MADIFDYLKWRGNLSLDAVPASAEDYLVFSLLAYCPFEELSGDDWKGTPLRELQDRIFLDNQPANHWHWWESVLMLWRRLPQYPRFADVRLADFVYEFDAQKPMQFAAAVFRTPCGTIAAFRGTDLSVTGWKENFMLGYSVPVPGQTAAVSLINSLPADCGRIAVCGHSKGGNLAMYGAVYAEDASRIDGVYNFDGPGMDDKTLVSDRWKRMLPLIHSYIPQSSVIGLLLGYVTHYVTVAAAAPVTLMQHDAFLWQFDGPRFKVLRDVTPSSSLINRALHDFFESCTQEQLTTLCTALNKLLDASHAERVDKLIQNSIIHLPQIIAAEHSFSPEETAILRQLRSLFIENSLSNIMLRVQLAKAKRRMKKTDDTDDRQ